MTTTQVQHIKRGINFLTDTSGQKVAVQIDLRNKDTRDLFEDLFDTLSVLERQDEKPRPFNDFATEYLAKNQALEV